MRGPGLRTAVDVRRTWRCPSCGYERHLAQTTTSVLCFCKDPPLQMKLVEGQRVVRPEPRPVARFIDESELPPDDSPAPVAPPPSVAPLQSVSATDTVIVESSTVETVVIAPASSEAETEISRNKKRRRRQRGRREGENDSPNETGERSERPVEPPVEPPAPPSEPDFGAGLEP